MDVQYSRHEFQNCQSKEPTADFKEVAEIFITTFKRKEVTDRDLEKDLIKDLEKPTENQKPLTEIYLGSLIILILIFIIIAILWFKKKKSRPAKKS